MSTLTEQRKRSSDLLVRRYEPKDRQQMLAVYAQGFMEMVTDTALRGLGHHPESLALYFLFTVVCLLLTQSWWMLVISPALVLCARYYHSWVVVRGYLDLVLSTDLRDVEEFYKPPDRCLWVAELEGQVVGMVAAHGDQTTGAVELLRMSVDQRYRKCGIGLALGRTFLQHAVAQKYSVANLSTTAYSPAAHRLYRRLGFRLVGTVNGHNTPGTAPGILQRIFYRVCLHVYKLELQNLD